MISSLSILTLIHSALSLVALVSGLDVLVSLIRGPLAGWTTLLYFTTSIAASASGFAFPFVHLLPSHVVGGLSLLALAAAVYARYGQRLAGLWRTVDAVGVAFSVYLLVFVAVAQAFTKIAALKASAPSLKEPPFAIAQGIVLLLFAAATVFAVRAARQPRRGRGHSDVQ
jgi:hypothetical protein